jgi:DNA repair protein RecN (Recombination protein N)
VLEELHVRDLALIEEARLELGPGMTVLSGETGAGKTVLVGALKLLLGERADATLVRSGAGEALIEGRFRVDDVERTARRRVGADGRSRCYLDGEMATVGALADALGPLVDLHGQHDHQMLLQPSRHSGIFDRFAGPPAFEALEGYREAYALCSRATAERDALLDAMRDREGRIAQLRFLVDEVDAVAPRPREDDEIGERLPLLRHGERLTEAASNAWASLSAEAGAGDSAAEALGALRRVEGLDPALDAMAAQLAELDVLLADAARRLRDYGEGVEFDPAALNEAEARLAALSTLKKKYGPALDDVLTARDRAAADVEGLEAGEEGIARAEARVAEAEAGLLEAAGALSGVREDAAAGFESALTDASRDLAMPGARFEVSRTPLDRESWTPDGPERLEFLYAPAPGEPPRPLARIASGGEVSRVMLALKGVLGDADPVPVLVFDEIDAGIGGATAVSVGRRLKALAEGRQVLVVTHLAQVAAFADAHLVVERTDSGGRAQTRVTVASGEERVGELARMLSGTDSDASIAHARELLESAGDRTV